MFKMFKPDGGRSMIEILLVLSIIAVLGTITMRQYSQASEKQKQMQFVAQIENIVKDINLRFSGRNFPGIDNTFVWKDAICNMLKTNISTFNTPWGGTGDNISGCPGGISRTINIIPSSAKNSDGLQFVILTIKGLSSGNCHFIAETMYDKVARDIKGDKVKIGTVESKCDGKTPPTATLIFSKF